MVLAGRGRAQRNVVNAAGVFSGHWTSSLIVFFVGDDLGVVIDGKKHLERLLPKMRENGLLIADRSTYFITRNEQALVLAAARYCCLKDITTLSLTSGVCAWYLRSWCQQVVQHAGGVCCGVRRRQRVVVCTDTGIKVLRWRWL
jgi:hypothetical protein